MTEILITGVAGFIGFHVAHRLLMEGHHVTGVDNLNDYYDVNLKQARLHQLINQSNFNFVKLDVSDELAIKSLFSDYQFTEVIHLAAQPGIRYSIEHPKAYIQSNIIGFFNILEACRHNSIAHLIYASSSSVYGDNNQLPFKTTAVVDHPLSLYAATKKSNELMAHSYSHLYKIPTTGLRFFTVYGPWGRPDMAIYQFTRDILQGRTLTVFNNGQQYRDFTYIDDIVESIIRVRLIIPTKTTNQSNSNTPSSIYNIGNQHAVNLLEAIKIIEKYSHKKANIEFMPALAGEMLSTHADSSDLVTAIDYTPRVSIDEGVRRFIEWYREYHSF